MKDKNNLLKSEINADKKKLKQKCLKVKVKNDVVESDVAPIITKRQRRIISDERILNAALYEFAKKGYTGASLLSIAKSAGVSVGLVAQNFGCKELLFESVCKRNHQILNLPYKGKKNDDWVSRICGIISRYEKDMQKSSFVCELQFISMALKGKDIPETFIEFFESSFSESELCEAIKIGQRNGTVTKGDPITLYKIVYSCICDTLVACKINGITLPDKSWYISLIAKRNRKSSNRNN